MTTETESLEALHLWLATDLPELRHGLAEAAKTLPTWHEGRYLTDEEKERGWVPNVSTDALLEALRKRGVSEVTFSLADDSTRTVCSLDSFKAKGFKEAIGRSAVAETLPEALCRAARKALEAAS